MSNCMSVIKRYKEILVIFIHVHIYFTKRLDYTIFVSQFLHCLALLQMVIMILYAGESECERSRLLPGQQ